MRKVAAILLIIFLMGLGFFFSRDQIWGGQSTIDLDSVSSDLVDLKHEDLEGATQAGSPDESANTSNEDGSAVNQINSISPLDDPAFGSAEYLSALENAEKFRPKRGSVEWEEVSKIDLQKLASFYQQVVEDGLSRSYRSLGASITLNLGLDTCTLSTGSVRSDGESVDLMGACDELPNSRATFTFNSELNEFDARIRNGNTEFYVYTLDDREYADSYRIDASSIRHND